MLGLSLAIPLGPINIEIIKQALGINDQKLGFFFAVLIGLGAMTGDFIVAFSVLTIGSQLFSDFISNNAIRTILLSFNALLLGYLSFSTLNKSYHRDSLDLDFEKKDQLNTLSIKRSMNRYFTGLILVITSPWSYLWWSSFGTLIIFGDFDSFNIISRLIIILMFLTGVFIWMLFFPGGLTISKKFASPIILQWITRSSAIIMIFYAVIFVFDAYQGFLLWFG
ncbi:MAG: LysE family transporter [Candidatus Hodarchaeales archaeon]